MEAIANGFATMSNDDFAATHTTHLQAFGAL
jgi:hypothetical protein